MIYTGIMVLTPPSACGCLGGHSRVFDYEDTRGRGAHGENASHHRQYPSYRLLAAAERVPGTALQRGKDEAASTTIPLGIFLLPYTLG